MKWITNNLRFRESGRILVNWFETKNWGDALNPYLIERISGIRPVRPEEVDLVARFEPIYSVIGSVLSWYHDPRLEVWGSGFMHAGYSMSCVPKRIHAVRGPLSRAKLLKLGIDSPEVYGDPALLLSRYFQPPKTNEFELGIIPANVDRGHPSVARLTESDEVLYIDIHGGIELVVENICRCKRIAASCLHGIIAADAYGIPNTWIQLEDNLAHFKFYDYMVSVGRNDTIPLKIDDELPVEAICERAIGHNLDIDLDLLFRSCPFAK